jgi:uncharacterized membrane protein
MPRFCAACGGQMADNASVCPACGKAAGQSSGGGAAAAPAASGGGLADNVAGGLAYVTIIPAIIFLIVEPYSKNKFVKFHAFQCLGLAVLGICFSIITVVPVLGWIVGLLGHLAVLVLWVICIIKAFQGGKFKIPVIGEFAEKQANA